MLLASVKSTNTFFISKRIDRSVDTYLSHVCPDFQMHHYFRRMVYQDLGTAEGKRAGAKLAACSGSVLLYT